MSIAKDGLRICGMVAVTVTYRVLCLTLYGADGEALIHSFDDDPAGRVGISWSLVSSGV
jgi:hypothetical protein